MIVLSACVTKPPPEEQPPLHTYVNDNYPNPYAGSMPWLYGLGDSMRVLSIIYDKNGSLIDTFIDTIQGPGEYTVPWETDSTNVSGVYFFHWTLGDSTVVKKFLLLK